MGTILGNHSSDEPLYQRFLSVVERSMDLIAVSNEKYQSTFADLARHTGALRLLLKSQMREGDRNGKVMVLVALPGGPQFTALQLACLAERVIFAAIPSGSTQHEAQKFVQLIHPDLVAVESTAGAGAILGALDAPVTILSLANADENNETMQNRVVTWPDVVSGKDIKVPVRSSDTSLPEDIALIQFTSGSTGRPKGILLSRENIASCLANNDAYFSETMGESVFCPMPQFHAFGGAVVIEHLMIGSAVHLANGFVPGDDLARMQKYRCTSIFAAPNYIRLMIKLNLLLPEALPDLHTVCMGTAAIDQGLVCDLRQRFPELTIYLRYGLTETMGAMTLLKIPPGDYLPSAGLVGPAVPGVKIQSGLSSPGEGEPGEVRVKGGIIARGFLSESNQWKPLVDADGYFSTGDLGYMDCEGQLHLRGRSSSFIKRNGFRINPFEIEELLRGVSGIHEVVAVGVPDEASGEQIVVCLEPAEESEMPATRGLLQLCRENLSPYKLPQRFIVMDKLPRNAAGKPDRPEVKRRVCVQLKVPF